MPPRSHFRGQVEVPERVTWALWQVERHLDDIADLLEPSEKYRVADRVMWLSREVKSLIDVVTRPLDAA